MDNTTKGLYDIIISRKNEPVSDSYTCYLFERGLDKILKKVGEECAEVIIAAKNDDKEELKEEVCDLLYHILVLLAQKGIDLNEINDILEKRRQKIGNLKKMRNTDKET